MQTQLRSNYLPRPACGGGGRSGSAALRYSQSLGERFAGLEEGANRYELLLLLKKTGALAGVTPRALDLLEYYLAYTRDCDWEEGARPLVYQSLTRTALDLGVSERQVQKLEAILFAAGVITWNDSGNHKRFGRRCTETGRIVYAFGVDLSPLAHLRGRLEKLLEDKRRRDEAWLETKRQVSWRRRHIRGLLLEAEGRGDVAIDDYTRRYNAIAFQIRTHLRLEQLVELLDRHRALQDELLALVEAEASEPRQPSIPVSTAPKTPNRSCNNVPQFAHSESTNQGTSSERSSLGDAGYREEGTRTAVHTDPATSSGMAHVSLGMAIDAAGPRLRERLSEQGSWSDLVEAAYQLRPYCGISQASWGEACSVLGRNGAALCLLLTDRGACRSDDPVRAPAAYFSGLVRRARRGELRLHKSVFGLLERGTPCH